MKTQSWLKIALLVSLEVFTFCNVIEGTIKDVEFELMVNGNNQFASKILEILGSNGNVFFSPLSLALALGMVLLGARKQSAVQIDNALNWSILKKENKFLLLRALQEAIGDSSQEQFELKLANRVWGHHRLLPERNFLNDLKEMFKTEMILRDFEQDIEGSREDINRWVEEQTNGKIKEFFPRGMITSATMLVLVNAIYFNGLWKYKFREEHTFQEPFYAFGNPDNGKNVHMMSLKGKFNYAHDERHECRVLELPYAEYKASMLLVLPEQLDGLSKLHISADNIIRWSSMLVNTTVSIALPKFQLNQKINLKQILPELGVKDIFEPSLANLSGISLFDNLLVSSAIHQAFVNVNEQGTEAAAATGVVMMKRSIDMFEIFQADHPFLFFIRHHPTNSILFAGKVVNIDDGNSITDRLTDEL